MSLREWARRHRNRFMGLYDVRGYRALGAHIGENVHIGPGARLDPPNAWMITIGDEVVIAPGVQVLAHDASMRRRIGHTKIHHTVIGDRVFIGAGTIVLPGASIGNDVVVGAGSVVASPIPANSLAFGNPARVAMPLSEYEERQRCQLNDGPIYNKDTPGRRYTMEERARMRQEIPIDGFGWGT